MTVALCMIVKDEADVIERCLDSALPLIDRFCIVDTGSKDGTQDRIMGWARRHNIVGELHQKPWVNFGVNRTQMLDTARDSADHLLMLDADWTISAPNGLFDADADVHFMRHQAGGVEWDQQFVVRGGLDWRFDGAAGGAVHEYLVVPPDRTRGMVREDVTVTIHASGGEARWERDVALLDGWLVEHPDDDRSVFYLAQTCADMGNAARAIEMYERRAAMGGWGEEVYCALYRAGLLKVAAGDWPAGLVTLMAAWESRPTRGEALYDLAAGLRLRGQDHAAYAFARAGWRLERPDDLLFVAPAVYEWGLLFEWSIAASRVGRHGEARAATDRLLNERALPPHIRYQVLSNVEFLPPVTPSAPRVVLPIGS